MKRRRMSLRAIAAMKRENRELRNTIESVRLGARTTRVARLTLSSVQDAEIRTSHTLGYTTVIRDNYDGTWVVLALRLEG